MAVPAVEKRSGDSHVAAFSKLSDPLPKKFVISWYRKHHHLNVFFWI
jgi:hypothetical protein